MKKKRILCDLDGTVAGWKNVPIEVYSKEGYYSNLDPVVNVIESIKKLCEDERFEVYIASAVLNDNHSVKDKNLWIDNYMPFIDIEHRVFTIETTDPIFNGLILKNEYDGNLYSPIIEDIDTFEQYDGDGQTREKCYSQTL